MADSKHTGLPSSMIDDIIQEWNLSNYIPKTPLFDIKSAITDNTERKSSSFFNQFDDFLINMHEEGTVKRMVEHFISNYKPNSTSTNNSTSCRDICSSWIYPSTLPLHERSDSTHNIKDVSKNKGIQKSMQRTVKEIVDEYKICTMEVGHINEGFTEIAYYMAEKNYAKRWNEMFVSCLIVDLVDDGMLHRHLLRNIKRTDCFQLLRPYQIVRGWVCQCSRRLEGLLIQIVAVEVYNQKQETGVSKTAGSWSGYRYYDKFQSIGRYQSTMDGIIGLLPFDGIPAAEYKIGKSVGSSDRYVPVGTHIRAMICPEEEDGESRCYQHSSSYIVLSFESDETVRRCSLAESRRWGGRSSVTAVAINGSTENIQPLGFTSSLRDDGSHLLCTGDDFECSPTFNTDGHQLYQSILNRRLLHSIESDRRYRNPPSMHMKMKLLDFKDTQHKYLSLADVPWKLIGYPTVSMGLSLTHKQSLQWADERVTEGVKYGRTKQFELAIEYYNAALQLHATHVDALVARGAAFANQLKFEAALTDFNRALEIDPTQRNALLYKQTIVSRLAEHKSKRTPQMDMQRTSGGEWSTKMDFVNDAILTNISMNSNILKQENKSSKDATTDRLKQSKTSRGYDLILSSSSSSTEDVHPSTHRRSKPSTSTGSYSSVDRRHRRRHRHSNRRSKKVGRSASVSSHYKSSKRKYKKHKKHRRKQSSENDSDC